MGRPDGPPGRVGGAIAVVPGSPPRVETDLPHTLADGDLIRLEGTNGTGAINDECYVKASGFSPRQCALYGDAECTTPSKLKHRYPSEATLSRLAKEDYAIVVGITKYATLTPLNGPETDALDFERWIRSSTGGCVPKTQSRHILSSMFASPAEPSATKPTLQEMKSEFIRYAIMAQDKPSFRVGRRLYIFLSGHGITPTHSVTPNFEETALLAADATSATLGEHLTGVAYAEWFRNHALFDEVILFADCCRDHKENVPPASPPLTRFTPERPPGRRFYAAATKLDSKAFEKACGNPPTVRGVFSYVLLGALESGTLQDENGWLTGSVLARYLHKAVPQYQHGQDPVIDYREQEDIQFVRRTGRPPWNVSISFPQEWIGRRVELIGRNYPKPDLEHVIDGGRWNLSLELAMYKIQVESGESQRFEIDTTDGVQDVSFL
jgi:hypothetical protein